jgi:hypothetical protein
MVISRKSISEIVDHVVTVRVLAVPKVSERKLSLLTADAPDATRVAADILPPHLIYEIDVDAGAVNVNVPLTAGVPCVSIELPTVPVALLENVTLLKFIAPV